MKFLEFIKKHLFLVIALTVILILSITLTVVAKKLFFSNKGDKFGNRLDGIENYPITGEMLKTIENDLKEMEQVKSVSNNLVGKRLDFIITVSTDSEVELSKNYSKKILEDLSDDIKGFYDIQVLVTCEDDKNENYPIVGYKHKSREDFVW